LEQTSEVDWLRSTTSNSLRLHLLARLVLWLFNYVLTLLKTYFYITDTAFLRYKMVYYRQVTWNKLHIHGFKGKHCKIWHYQGLSFYVGKFLISSNKVMIFILCLRVNYLYIDLSFLSYQMGLSTFYTGAIKTCFSPLCKTGHML
jgi:hypothetical protein